MKALGHRRISTFLTPEQRESNSGRPTRESRKFDESGWTRTTDLTLIRRAL